MLLQGGVQVGLGLGQMPLNCASAPQPFSAFSTPSLGWRRAQLAVNLTQTFSLSLETPLYLLFTKTPCKDLSMCGLLLLCPSSSGSPGSFQIIPIPLEQSGPLPVLSQVHQDKLELQPPLGMGDPNPALRSFPEH